MHNMMLIHPGTNGNKNKDTDTNTNDVYDDNFTEHDGYLVFLQQFFHCNLKLEDMYTVTQWLGLINLWHLR